MTSPSRPSSTPSRRRSAPSPASFARSRAAEPDLVERVRGGWALIGYDIRLGRKRRYVGFIAPEAEHMHLGFELGTLMRPRGVLEGALLAESRRLG